MNFSSSAPRFHPSSGQRPRQAQGGFTLVEVMISVFLLTLISLGLLSTLIGAYRISAAARYRDRARYVIKSFADQFLTQEAIDVASGNPFPLFVVTVNTTTGDAMARGDGMPWLSSDSVVSPDSQHSYMTITLGDASWQGVSPVQATVTRQVSYVYANSGSPTLVNQNATPGYMLEGDFVISYSFLGRNWTQTLTAVRAVP